MTNQVTPEEFKALKERFHGRGTLDETMAVLREAGNDPALPPIVRINLAGAIVDLVSGRSPQSTMARFRRATGLDPVKGA